MKKGLKLFCIDNKTIKNIINGDNIDKPNSETNISIALLNVFLYISFSLNMA